MVEINLLPQQYRKQSQPNIWKYATWALLPITAAALLIPWLMTSTKTGDIQKQIDAVQGDIDTLTPLKQEHDRLMNRKKELDQVTATSQILTQQKSYWSNDVAAFSSQIPSNSGVGLTKMDITTVNADTQASNQKAGLYAGKAVRRQITLEGQAASEQAVINFLNIFENSPNFGVNFKGMQRPDKDKNYTFNADVGIVDPSAPTTTTPVAGAPGTPPAGATQAAAAPAAPGATPAAGVTPSNTPAISPAARTADATGGTNVK